MPIKISRRGFSTINKVEETINTTEEQTHIEESTKKKGKFFEFLKTIDQIDKEVRE